MITIASRRIASSNPRRSFDRASSSSSHSIPSIVDAPISNSTHNKAAGGMRSSSGSSSTASSTHSSPIVEMRKYQLDPRRSASINELCGRDANRPFPPHLAFVGMPMTGALSLDTSLRLYHYPGGHAERSDVWSDDDIGDVDPAFAVGRSSELYVEAPLVRDIESIAGLGCWTNGGNDGVGGAMGGRKRPGYHDEDGDATIATASSSTIVELRKYQLRLGYDAVPNFLRIYSGALPSKLNASGTHPTTRLISVLVCDVGRLNTVYEVWKHGGGGAVVGWGMTSDVVADGDECDASTDAAAATPSPSSHRPGNERCCGFRAMEISRMASRNVDEWRDAIRHIAELALTFDTTILRPHALSPLR